MAPSRGQQITQVQQSIRVEPCPRDSLPLIDRADEVIE
jgi:hypothetical protein